jgi:hypothetical protein
VLAVHPAEMPAKNRSTAPVASDGRDGISVGDAG